MFKDLSEGIGKYVIGAFFFSYVVYGGCDPNVREVFRDKYAEKIIEARQGAAGLISRKSKILWNAVKAEENLEDIVEDPEISRYDFQENQAKQKNQNGGDKNE